MKQEFDDEISLSDIVLRLWQRRGLVCAGSKSQENDQDHSDGED